MQDQERPHRELQILRRKHDESNTMLTIMMAGVAGLFLIGIVAVYNYSTNPSVPEGAPASASIPATIGTQAPAETTGSGSTQPTQMAPNKSQRN